MPENDLSAVLNQARQLRQKRAFGPALALFEKYSSDFANNGRFLADNALTQAEAGLARSAVSTMERAVATAHDELSVLLDAARLQVLTGRPRRALELCAHARSLSKRSAPLLAVEGDAFYQAGLLKEAEKAYLAALEIAPETEAKSRLTTVRKRLEWLAIANTDPVLDGSDIPSTVKPSDAPQIDVVIPVAPDSGSIQPVLRALAMQSFKDFAVHVIAASTDEPTAGTVWSWRDKLDITLHAVSAPTGYADLANRALTISDRDYVLVAKAEDTFSARYIEALLDRIKASGNIAFCHAGAVHVDAEGNLADTQPPQQTYETDGSKPLESALVVMRHFNEPNQFHGLYRRTALEQAGSIPFVFGGDHVHAFMTAMTGDVVYVDEPLYYRRITADDFDRGRNIDRGIRAFSVDTMHDVARESAYSSLDYLAPFVDMARAHIDAAARAPIPGDDKKRIIDAIPGVFLYRFGFAMEDDAKRIALFLDENETNIRGLANNSLRNRLVENLLTRILCARALLPAHEGLRESLKRALALSGKP